MYKSKIKLCNSSSSNAIYLEFIHRYVDPDYRCCSFKQFIVNKPRYNSHAEKYQVKKNKITNWGIGKVKSTKIA